MDPLKPGQPIKPPIPPRPVTPPVIPPAPAAAPAAPAPSEAAAPALRGSEAAAAALLAGTALLGDDAIAAALAQAVPEASGVPAALTTAVAHGRLSGRQLAAWAAVREALPDAAARARWDAWAVEGSGPATFATPAGRELLSIAADLLKPGTPVPGGGPRAAYLASLLG